MTTTDSDVTAQMLSVRFAALEARLSADNAPAEREALKSDISVLYRHVVSQLQELESLKSEIREMVERWKALPFESAASADIGRAPSRFAGERPLVVDHIGASTFTEKGWSLISAGDYVAAEHALKRSLELSPNEPQAESLLGWAQMLQENFDDALLNFQRSLLRDPGNMLARVNLGFICLKKGIIGEAIEHLSRVIRVNNDRRATLYAHFYLGLVYLEREMYEDAETFFRRAIALGPNLLEAYFELGRALWLNGRSDLALQTWREGSALNKFSPWGKRCEEMLKHVAGGGEPARVS